MGEHWAHVGDSLDARWFRTWSRALRDMQSTLESWQVLGLPARSHGFSEPEPPSHIVTPARVQAVCASILRVAARNEGTVEEAGHWTIRVTFDGAKREFLIDALGIDGAPRRIPTILEELDAAHR